MQAGCATGDQDKRRHYSIAASNLEQTVDALTKDLVEAKGYKLQKAETVKLTKETAHADE